MITDIVRKNKNTMIVYASARCRPLSYLACCLHLEKLKNELLAAGVDPKDVYVNTWETELFGYRAETEKEGENRKAMAKQKRKYDAIQNKEELKDLSYLLEKHRKFATTFLAKKKVAKKVGSSCE